MDNSIKTFRRRRAERIANKKEKRFDSVEAYKKRREARLQARFDANPQIAYGIAKGMGIKTEGMSPKEVWEAIRKEGGGKGIGKNAPKNGNNANNGANGKNGVNGNGGGRISGVSEKMAKAAGYVGGWLPPKVKGMKDAAVHKVMSACHKIGGSHYENGSKVANEAKNTFLRTFTTHGLDHVQQVVEKTNQAADAIEQIKDTHEFHHAKVDRNLMLVASWFHDTGMDGGSDQAKWAQDNGIGIRDAHGMNSALHILEHAEEIQKMGVNPSQAAFVAFAHTKSKSGIDDLQKVEDWVDGLDRLEKAAKEAGLDFDRDSIFGGEPNQDNIGHMAAQVAALRLGDANREANIPLRSQTGGEYNIDQQPDHDACGDLGEEEQNSKISIDINGEVHKLEKGDPYMEGVSGFMYSKHVVLGERNMTKIDTEYNQKHDSLQLNVELAGGNDCPWSTTEALLERCGELNTINGVPRAIKITMTGINSPDDMHDNAMNAYLTMWHTIRTSRIADGKKNAGMLKYQGIADVVLEFENGDKMSMSKMIGPIIKDVKKVKNEQTGEEEWEFGA